LFVPVEEQMANGYTGEKGKKSSRKGKPEKQTKLLTRPSLFL
jgi:hypothetical protein